MHPKIIFFIIVLLMTVLVGFAWAAGEGRRQIRPLDYQSLRSFTESQQVIPNYLADRYPDNFEDKIRRDAARYVPSKRRFKPNPLNYGQLRIYLDRQYESPPDNPLTRDIYSRRKSVRTIIREPMDMR
ncbi:MAG TPA: hypothetical protein DGB85_12715 [Deltaproteobacteria bacterium]|nr:hypothetical protein [Deltaproteobacteria bacterium]